MAEQEKKSHYRNQIRKNLLFHYMKEEELNAILANSDIVRYQDGERIISQGEVSQYVFGVIAGRVDVSARNHEDEVYIHSIEEGDIFGEAAIFLTELRTASVLSFGESVVIQIHRNDLVSFIRDYAQAGNRVLIFIIYSLLKKLRSSTKEIAAVKHLSVEQKRMESQMKKVMKEI